MESKSLMEHLKGLSDIRKQEVILVIIIMGLMMVCKSMGIEQHPVLHWTKDVIMKEDECRIHSYWNVRNLEEHSFQFIEVDWNKINKESNGKGVKEFGQCMDNDYFTNLLF